MIFLFIKPERIDPTRATRDGYDVRSDVWSLGITLVNNLNRNRRVILSVFIFQYEISTGYFPFREWTSVFDQLQQIVEGPELELKIDRLSDNCKNFVNTW